MKMKALFLDRDGVINVDKSYVYKIRDFEFIDGIFKVLYHFQTMGYVLLIITNQAGIARGYYKESDLHLLNKWMTQQFKRKGICISKVYYCPYHPEYGQGEYKKDSYCRKPKPGMILQAKKEFNLDLLKSILIGDKESDIMAGKNAGINTNILVNSNNNNLVADSNADIIINNIKELLHFDEKIFD